MSVYKTIFEIVNQRSVETQGVSDLCCLCFNKVGDDATLLEDEVIFDTNYGPSTEKMANILWELLGDQITENYAMFEEVCNQCSRLAINSYKFVKQCKDNAEQFVNAIDNVIDCFENTTETLYNFQTMYVSINTNDLAFEQFYDNKHQAQDTALARFRFLAHGKRIKTTKRGEDNAKQKRARDFSTIFIKTQELKLDPNSPEFTCKLCMKTYPTSGTLRLHFFSVHFKKEYQCSLCPKSFGTAGLLQTHEKESHCTVECTQCGKLLLNRTSTIKRHKLSHLTRLTKICHRCGRKYKKIADFNRHMEQATCDMPSRIAGSFICDHCGKECHFKHQLKAHIKFEHDNAEGHVCKWCGRKCYNESALRTHILKHTGEKNFICATCGGKFVTRQSLINHTRLHTGERPYPCQHCEQSFLSASRRSEHIERYHTVATFECDMCDAKYSARRSLHKHRKLHDIKINL